MSPAEPEAHSTPGLGCHLVTCIYASNGCLKPLNYSHQNPQDMQTHCSPSYCALCAQCHLGHGLQHLLRICPCSSLQHLQFSLEIPSHICTDLASPWYLETS